MRGGSERRSVWTADGVPLSPAASPKIVSDGAGGAVVGFEAGGLYVERVDPGGTKLWGDIGLPLCVAAGWKGGLEFVSDGVGGVIASWVDGRSGGLDIYAQRIDPTGSLLWVPNGVLIGGAPDQDQIAMVGSFGGAIVVFADRRGSSIDLYAQRISAAGSLGGVTGIGPGPLHQQAGLGVAPLPAIHEATFFFELPAAGAATIHLFDIRGRLVRRLDVPADGPGAHRLRWDLRDERGSRLPGGVYLARRELKGEVRAARGVGVD
jgi:hypothetical protein